MNVVEQLLLYLGPLSRITPTLLIPPDSGTEATLIPLGRVVIRVSLLALPTATFLPTSITPEKASLRGGWPVTPGPLVARELKDRAARPHDRMAKLQFVRRDQQE